MGTESIIPFELTRELEIGANHFLLARAFQDALVPLYRGCAP